MKFKKIGLMLLVAFALILTACGKSQSQNGKLKVMLFILFMILQKILSEMKER